MSEIEELEKRVVELTEKVIILQQALSVSMRTEPSGTTTVGNLENASAAQLDDNPLFYIEHADGGLNVYLSQIVAETQKNIPAENITSGTLGLKRVPAAPNSPTAGSGFGGFRYQKDGTTLKLFVS